VHLFGNIIFGSLFITFLGREMKVGIVWFMVLLSGIAGNWISVFLRHDYYQALGASTAIFGAVGILCALRFLKRKQESKKSWFWMAFALGVFSLLGTAENSDVLAHFTGLVSGFLVGMGFGLLYEKYRFYLERFNIMFHFFSICWLILCWYVALKR
jgi:membrane associated rhomboid family serine protease